jgi:hypothetical protein
MIKLTFALTRLPSLSRAEFQDYWYNTHGPLVATVSEVLGIRRYVQMHSAPDETSEACAPAAAPRRPMTASPSSGTRAWRPWARP